MKILTQEKLLFKLQDVAYSLDSRVKAADDISASHAALLSLVQKQREALEKAEIGLVHCVPIVGYDPQTLHIIREVLYPTELKPTDLQE